jgi:hypothetical protein
MNSQFEQALKVASHIGAQQAYDRIRARHGLEKSAGLGTMLGALTGAVSGPEGQKAESIAHYGARGLGIDIGAGLGASAGALGGAAVGNPMKSTYLLKVLASLLGGAGAGGYGGYKVMDKIMGKTPNEKSAGAVLGAAAKGGGGMANAFSGALKSKGGKAALLGTGLLGAAGGAGAYGGAQYGKNKTIDTIKTNMDNQGLMDRLKTIFQYLMGNSGAVMNNLGLENKAPTGV